MGSMCVIAPWPRSWPRTRLLWRSRLVRASSVVLSGCAVACVACCRVEVCRVVRDLLPACRMRAVTCFCVSPGVGSGCHVVFSPHGWVCGVLPIPRQAWGTLPHGAQHPSRCLAGTAWGRGAQAQKTLRTNPSHRLGAQEKVTPRMLGHAGDVQGTLGPWAC